MQGTVHIIGAGLAGLSAATTLVEAGRHVAVYEAAAQAGGRCRSYYDTAFGGVIDNGNHLVLSGNEAVMTYLKRINSGFGSNAKDPAFDFIDRQTMQRWQLRLSKGRIPWWIGSSTRRIPGTRFTEYFSLLRLLKAASQQKAGALLDTHALLYQRLWHPLLLSVLNTDPIEASATLAAAIIRGTLLKGGAACVPLVAEGLSGVFIDPALRYLSTCDVKVQMGQRVRHIQFDGERAAALEFASGEPATLTANDSVILAAPPWEAASLLPGLQVPDDYRAILNVHFRVKAPAGAPAILGVIHATTEWIFAFPDRISVTVSSADRLMQEDRETLVRRIWQEVSAVTGLAGALPPWQIVKEKRATFAATPAQNAKRPQAATKWRNIHLAGDYVQTGLPATIEGAIRSGMRAAELALAL